MAVLASTNSGSSGIRTVTVTHTEKERRLWLGDWMREESFWRDVATRTLAIVISGAVVYVLALAGGYVQRPDVRRVAIAVSLSTLSIYLFIRLNKVTEARSDWVSTASLYAS